MKGSAARKAQEARVPHFSLAPLPYAYDALAPAISEETMHLHHDKHHQTYVDKTNKLLEEHPVEGETLEQIVRACAGVPERTMLFNNAGQAWNHDFYWQSLSPKSAEPSGALLQRIEKDLGGYQRFAKAFATAASGQFGSGWAWLIVNKNGALDIVTTSNADTPMARGIPCLLTVDVWEHAYYVDYRNLRDKYLEAVISSRLNWDFAAQNLEKSSARK
jgi:Fe-Mn family superoxide dismutase